MQDIFPPFLPFSFCHYLPRPTLCHFHTVYTVRGVLKARILKWFAIPFSSGSCFVRTLHHDLFWVALHSMTHSFIELYKAVVHVTLKDELPSSVGAQYSTGDQWRNNSRNNEEMEPKQTQHPVVDVTDDRSKVQCCKEQYCIGTWNVGSMNQGKLEVVKQEMARVNVDILGISELRWTGMGEFNSDDHHISYCGQESLQRNGVAIMINKRVQ